MLNQVQLIGRVGKDPEVKTLNSGTRMVSLSIATSERWRDKSSGERKEKTEWHNIVVFNEQIVKVIEEYVGKGDLIYIQGKMQTRKWQDQQGNDRWSTEVVLENFNGKMTMLGSKKDSDRDSGGDRGQSTGGGDDHGNSRGRDGGSDRGGYSSGFGGGQGFSADLDDEIPF